MKCTTVAFIFIVCLLGWLSSCNSPYTSRKRGYFHVDFPEHKYQTFNQNGFPFTFEYPVYAKAVRDSVYFDAAPENPYWLNVDFPLFNARLFISYKQIGGKSVLKVKNPDGTYRDSLAVNQFDYLIRDAYQLTSKNDIVATSIRDSLFRNPNGVSGVLFKVGGNAATALQFLVTDTTTHFLRGALYFEATPNADSLRPSLEFLNYDINHMIQSFQWRN